MNTPEPVKIPEGGPSLLELLVDRSCSLCCEDLKPDNCLLYRNGRDVGWYLSPCLCRSCLEDFRSASGNSVDGFVRQLTDLRECSKMMRNLVSGELGVPVNIRDLHIFPIAGTVPNHLDPRFGRSNEVLEINSGSGEPVSPGLKDAPRNGSELRGVLLKVLEVIEGKLADFDLTRIGSPLLRGEVDDVGEIRRAMADLRSRLD